jgi:hypothetical protein
LTPTFFSCYNISMQQEIEAHKYVSDPLSIEAISQLWDHVHKTKPKIMGTLKLLISSLSMATIQCAEEGRTELGYKVGGLLDEVCWALKGEENDG